MNCFRGDTGAFKHRIDPWVGNSVAAEVWHLLSEHRLEGISPNATW